MLQADKQKLLTDAKRNALELRQLELDFNVERFTNLATQASVIAGFSFESLVELEVPEETHWMLSSAYFIFGSAAMAISLYCLVVASFACVLGHRLALQGPHGSLERAVNVMVSHRVHIFSAAGVSLLCLVFAAVLMSWIKMGPAAVVVSTIFLVFAASVFHRMRKMFNLFEIPPDLLVTGAVQLNAPSSKGAAVDLSKLNPRAAAPVVPFDPTSNRYRPLEDSSAPPESSGRRILRALTGASKPEPSAAPPAADSAPKAEPVSLGHQGHLYKKGEAGLLRSEAPMRRRYFVLTGGKLYYFKAWEDYGSGGIGAAVNYASPIIAAEHEALALPAQPDGPNRFDLVHISDALARKWELQAASTQERADWLSVLRAARAHATASGAAPSASIDRANTLL